MYLHFRYVAVHSIVCIAQCVTGFMTKPMTGILTESDLSEVRTKVWDARNKWFDLGIELKLNHADLTAIQQAFGTDPTTCLTEMLVRWLKTGRATWAKMIVALKHPAVGNSALAGKVESLCHEPQQLLVNVSTVDKQQKAMETEIWRRIQHFRSLLNKQGDALVRQLTEQKEKMACNLDSELAYLKFTDLSKLEDACQNFGEVCFDGQSPVKCNVNEEVTLVCAVKQNETLDCELKSTITDETVECSTKKIDSDLCEISYQASTQGTYSLDIKSKEEHRKGSVTVKLPISKLGTQEPIKTIKGLKAPYDVEVTKEGEIVIVEDSSLSIFTQKGEKQRTITSGLDKARGVVVDSDSNILVMENGKNRIVKFSSDGRQIAMSKEDVEFNSPRGISIHPTSKRIYVADDRNHRILILSPELMLYREFGTKGSDRGQFNHPHDIAFDSTGNAYIADKDNNRVQVFTEEGLYQRQFGDSELHSPFGVVVSKEDNVVYVSEYGNHRVSIFNIKGEYLTSFGQEGSSESELYEPRGIDVDKSGVVYVCDIGTDCVKLF